MYWQCVSVVLGIQHAMRMHRTVNCGLARYTELYILFYKIIIWKQIDWKNCVLVCLQYSYKTFHILRRNERDTIKVYIGFHLKKLTVSLNIRKFEFPSFTVNGLWYWVAKCYKYCELQTAVASLQKTDCDTEWLIGINVVSCRQQLLICSQGIVIQRG